MKSEVENLQSPWEGSNNVTSESAQSISTCLRGVYRTLPRGPAPSPPDGMSILACQDERKALWTTQLHIKAIQPVLS